MSSGPQRFPLARSADHFADVPKDRAGLPVVHDCGSPVRRRSTVIVSADGESGLKYPENLVSRTLPSSSGGW